MAAIAIAAIVAAVAAVVSAAVAATEKSKQNKLDKERQKLLQEDYETVEDVGREKKKFQGYSQAEQDQIVGRATQAAGATLQQSEANQPRIPGSDYGAEQRQREMMAEGAGAAAGTASAQTAALSEQKHAATQQALTAEEAAARGNIDKYLGMSAQASQAWLNTLLGTGLIPSLAGAAGGAGGSSGTATTATTATTAAG